MSARSGLLGQGLLGAALMGGGVGSQPSADGTIWSVDLVSTGPIASASSPALFARVVANKPDGTNVDPTGDSVSFAFLPLAPADGSKPGPGTVWSGGLWSTTGAGYTAEIQLGSAGVDVPSGEYVVWVKIIHNAVTIVIAAGFVTLF